jgi:hypothetical protein
MGIPIGSSRSGHSEEVYVELVIGLEVSRLACNCSDWHRLLEICAFRDTLHYWPLNRRHSHTVSRIRPNSITNGTGS